MEYMSSLGTNTASTKDWVSSTEQPISGSVPMFVDGRVIIGTAPPAQPVTVRVETSKSTNEDRA